MSVTDEHQKPRPSEAWTGHPRESFCYQPFVSTESLSQENPRGCPILTAFFAVRVGVLTLLSTVRRRPWSRSGRLDHPCAVPSEGTNYDFPHLEFHNVLFSSPAGSLLPSR